MNSSLPTVAHDNKLPPHGGMSHDNNNSLTPNPDMIKGGGNSAEYSAAVYGDMHNQKAMSTGQDGNSNNEIAYDLQKAVSLRGGSRRRRKNGKKSRKTKRKSNKRKTNRRRK